MIIDFTGEPEQLATPFESWCASVGIHPDHWDAWSLYERSLPAVEHPAAS